MGSSPGVTPREWSFRWNNERSLYMKPGQFHPHRLVHLGLKKHCQSLIVPKTNSTPTHTATAPEMR